VAQIARQGNWVTHATCRSRGGSGSNQLYWDSGKGCEKARGYILFVSLAGGSILATRRKAIPELLRERDEGREGERKK
jgi:hypothetical protein